MTNLQVRIISALVLAVAALGLAWLGGFAFRLFSALVAAGIFYEWSRMARAGKVSRGRGDYLPEALMLIFIVALLAGLPALHLLLLVCAIVLIAFIVETRQRFAQWEAAGLAYASLSGLSLSFLRGGDKAGLSAIVFLFAVVWATDIFAYFVGRAVGGPKLAPSISPGKTRSGAVGGAVGGVVAGVLVARAVGSVDLVAIAAAALFLSIVSQAGDLFESWVKRRHGCKDSSNLIPGHGGVMDRVDGLVAAAFALYLIGWASVGADNPAHALFRG